MSNNPVKPTKEPREKQECSKCDGTGMGEPQKFYAYPGYVINGCPTCGHCLGTQVEPIEVKP